MDDHIDASAVRTIPNWIESLQEITWLLLVILAPLWINLWGQQPFDLSKVVLVRTLVWLLFGLAIFSTIVHRRAPADLLRANPLMGAAALLGLVLIVTMLTAVDRPLALWGSYDRGQGAITQLTYLLLFFLAADHFRESPRVRYLFAAMAGAGLPLVLIGLAQFLGWNPFNLISDARSPVFATLGRANFLGAYLVMLLPLTLALGVGAGGRERTAWLVLLAGELLVIGLTDARGAWLAAGMALGLFALLTWGERLPRVWRRLAWGGTGLLALAGPLAVLILGARQAGSEAARLAIWRGTLELIGRRPLTGYGADGLGLVFPRVYPPELVYFQGREFFVDRAHNLLLDWAAASGLPGLLAFSIILGSFVVLTGRALQETADPGRRLLLAAALAAVLGNAANNLVSFDVTATAAAGWLLMGVGTGLAAPALPAFSTSPVVSRPARTWAVAGLLLAAFGAAAWQGNGRPLAADIAARSAHRLALAGDFTGAAAAGEQAVRRWPLEPAHHLHLSQIYWELAAADPAAAEAWLAQAEGALIAAGRLRPDEMGIWLQTANFYAAAARQYGFDTWPLADGAYRRALALAPHHAVVYSAWGRMLLDAGDPAAAAPLLREAVRLDASSGEAYLALGAAELALGRREVALADYREAVRLLPDAAAAYAGLASSHLALGQVDEALAAVELALQRDPLHPQALALRGQLRGQP